MARADAADVPPGRVAPGTAAGRRRRDGRGFRDRSDRLASDAGDRQRPEHQGDLARRFRAGLRRAQEPTSMTMRIGEGWDVHALVPGRPLVIGGVAIPYDRGLLGHSDADVLLHAITDALLGAAGLGDIGR